MKSITHWTRLEPRSRSDDFGPSLRAEVRDPAWILCRQWQLGELAGHDGGSPARLETQVDMWRLDNGGPDAPPLEARVEGERIGFDLRARAQAGLVFLRLLRREGLLHRSATFLAVAPLGVSPSMGIADTSSRSFADALAARVLDGGRLLEALDGGQSLWALPLPDGNELPPALRIDDPIERTKVDAAAAALRAWRDAVYGRAPNGDSPSWQPHALAYGFEVGLEGGPTDALVAEKSATGSLDWPDFDLAISAPAPTAEPLQTSVVPSAVTFPGMAAARFWEFEDARVDFGAMTVQVGDLGRLLLVEYALVSGDDWYWIPLTAPAGALLRVRQLNVSDVFGERWDAPAAGADTGYRLFGLSGLDAGSRVLLVPPAVPVTNAPPIEEVVFFRDEAANLAWAVERTLPNALGEPISGRAVSPAPAPETGQEALTYQLVSNLAEHWTPFQAVRREGSRRRIAFERAALLRTTSAGTLEPIEPRGRILNPADFPYRLDEEAIGRVPLLVQRSFQRARTSSGRSFLWIGRRSMPTRSDGPSGLAFDQLVEPG